ncbi:MAG: DNA/RNA non-specific endonuclease [Bryobacterales bacterium]|nr:DNA/RNA non-specific endonuclease [Bryobacterales bacterium]
MVLPVVLMAQSSRHGVPACNERGEELADRTYFVLCHSANLKVPVWVGYELKPEHLRSHATGRPRFRRDTQLTHTGATDSDYAGSGYSRGHMAPAADFAWSTEALHSTYVLSNAVPQLQSVNGGPWVRLENAIRRLARDADVIHVFSGPVFDHDAGVIGKGGVAVPTHFFKAVLVEQSGRRMMYAAIVPNTPTSHPMSQFFVSVEEVELRTGLDLFSSLEDDEEHRLESYQAPWPTVR